MVSSGVCVVDILSSITIMLMGFKKMKWDKRKLECGRHGELDVTMSNISNLTSQVYQILLN